MNNPQIILKGGKVKPDYGQPGGGSEFMTKDKVKVKIINYQPLK